MTRSLSAVCLALGILVAAACGRDAGDGNGAQVPSSQQGVAAQTSFNFVDQDNDGFVSRDEAGAVEGLDLSAADVDGDGRLSRDEYAAAMERARPRG